jgi:hypothetical protein
MQYPLRTLLILLAVGPLVLAVAWFVFQSFKAHQDIEDMWRNPARYSELEGYLIKKGVAKRGPNNELQPVPANNN